MAESRAVASNYKEMRVGTYGLEGIGVTEAVITEVDSIG